MAETIDVQEVKNLIKQYRRKEEEFRIKGEVLDKLLKGSKKAQSKESGASPFSGFNNRPSISKEIAGVILVAMKSKTHWQLSELQKHVNSELGRKVASSTMRSVLNKDPRFKKVSYGVYSLASCDTDIP